MDHQFVEFIQEPKLETITHASMDWLKFHPVIFVAISPNKKAPFICKRKDVGRSVLREYPHVKATENTLYIHHNNVKYLLTPCE